MLPEHGYLLVVDVDPTNRDTLNTFLENCGYTVTVTDNVSQALTMLKMQTYDLMLLALNLPEVDGMRILQSLREVNVPVPVIMLASESDIQHIESCIELGLEDYIAAPFNQVILRTRIRSCLEKLRLRSKEFTDREREAITKLERDFEIGRQLQEGFLPKVLPILPDWEIVPYYNAARVVGGDLYDVFEITENGLLGLIIGDVCDKGLPAALFMALFRTFFRAAGQQYYPLGWTSAGGRIEPGSPEGGDRLENFRALSAAVLKSSFELANKYILNNHSEAGYFVTLFFAVLDTRTGAMYYTNGGHLPVFIIGPNGIKARLSANGPAVGFLPNAHFDIHQAQIEPGDIMFSYSDGVTDARDLERRLFGMQRLVELVEQPAASAEALMQRVDAAVSTHISNAEQYDDITMLVVRRIAK